MIKVVSVIIISYNTKDLMLKCLSHLYKSAEVELEVIVVDNGSTDESVEEIGKRYPEVKMIMNKTNLGFGKANNQGMKEASGEYYLLLNSDCFVEPETIKTLLKAMEAMKNVDMAGCKLLNVDGSTQASFGYFPNLWRIVALMLFVDNLPLVRKFFPSIHVREISRYSRLTDVDWVMGALVLLRKEVFKQTGGFDEQYFMYGEEVEWMKRVKTAGYRIVYIPQTTATHIGGASSPNKAPALIGEMTGWKYWFAKYNSSLEQMILPVVVSLGCMLRIILKPDYSKFYKQALGRIWQ
jgi:GT2 family glycosyltransferase